MISTVLLGWLTVFIAMPAAQAAPPVRVFVFTGPAAAGEAAAAVRGRNDSVKDLEGALKKKKTLVVSDSRDRADVVIEVLSRGEADTGEAVVVTSASPVTGTEHKDVTKVTTPLLRLSLSAAGQTVSLEGRAARFLDVRTPSEVAQGKIPGALHIPLDDLERRRGELPRDGRTTLIYCAGGGRSAAACDYLSREGWTDLVNLEGGIQSWTGPLERP